MGKIFGKKEETALQEVDFGQEGLDLHIAKPTLRADNTLDIGGNFSSLGEKIQKLVNRYQGVELTEENIAYVKTLKGQFVSLRTGIERERREYKKAYIEPASKLVDSLCADLQSIVAKGENALAVQLDAYEQKRKDELAVILEGYAKEAAANAGLREEFASKIVLIDKYFNRTQKEEDTIEDIERQAEELKGKQKEYDSSCLLLKEECERLNVPSEPYIRELQYKGASEIIMEIREDAKGKETEDVPCPEEKEVKEEKPEEPEEPATKSCMIKITYTKEQAKKLNYFLKREGIIFEIVM